MKDPRCQRQEGAASNGRRPGGRSTVRWQHCRSGGLQFSWSPGNAAEWLPFSGAFYFWIIERRKKMADESAPPGGVRQNE